MPYRVLTNQSELIEANPAPVNADIRNLALFELLAFVNVKHLNDGLISSDSTHCDYVLFLVHQNAVSFHVSSDELKVFGGVDDGNLLIE